MPLQSASINKIKKKNIYIYKIVGIKVKLSDRKPVLSSRFNMSRQPKTERKVVNQFFTCGIGHPTIQMHNFKKLVNFTAMHISDQLTIVYFIKLMCCRCILKVWETVSELFYHM